MARAAHIAVGIFIILLALTFLGLAMPKIVLGLVGLIAGFLMLAAM